MSATRLLILGALRSMQPAHGYEVRRELESRRAEHWANVAYGSIYFALHKLAREGLIEAVGTEQEGRRPARTSYVVTPEGEAEFQRLLREQWWLYRPTVDPFHVALSFMDQLPREELLAALRHRLSRQRAGAESLSTYAQRSKLMEDAPPHVEEIFRLSAAHAEAEARWAEELIGKVERGELP